MVLFCGLSFFEGSVENMHQALYRKWRPQSFSDVCGQDHITSILKYQIDSRKFSHAYLFCGSRGTGKTTCAKIFAKAVNCLSPKDGNPCGECENCRRADSGGCIDIIEMDAASNNGVDDIRQIKDAVEFLPAELKYKVYIIDEVHMLSVSAFNALLKTLEEPPAHVIFILATTELQKIPATVLSRCQRFEFRRISSEIIAGRLKYIAENEGISLDGEAAFMLAKLAQGGMRDAISLLELCSGEGRPITPDVVEEIVGSSGRDCLIRILEAVCNKDYDVIFSEIGKMYGSGKDLTVFWQELIAFYRDMLIVKTSKSASEYLELSDRQYSQLLDIAGRFSTETLIYQSGLLDGALENMRRSASSKRLIAEMTLVRLCEQRFAATTEALAARLGAVEDKLKSGAFAQPRGSSSAVKGAEIIDGSDNRASVASIPDIGTSNRKIKDGGASVPEHPPAQDAENAGGRSDGGAKDGDSPVKPEKREYIRLPYWAELVDKCSERDAMLGGFLRESAKGFKVSTDDFIHIRTQNPMAQSIITAHFATFIEVLNTFEDGRADARTVKFEFVPEKTSSNAIDELIESSGQ